MINIRAIKKLHNVIGKDSGNWFNTFIIDKGSKDGIEKDMNVIAGSGLVGIVTDVAPNYAKVKSIIDDTSSVSGMDLATSDNCIIRGNLQMMNENQEIELSDLKDTDDQVQAGDQIVTSYISDKHLPGNPDRIYQGCFRGFQRSYQIGNHHTGC